MPKITDFANSDEFKFNEYEVNGITVTQGPGARTAPDQDSGINKIRLWEGILYPENMREDWQDIIGDIIQVPYAYCIHDKDLRTDGDECRKVHVHCIGAFGNTTTRAHAIKVFNLLSKPGMSCCPLASAVIYAGKAYDYLIHNTEECKRLGKHLYCIEERIEGNNFDIDNYVQMQAQEFRAMRRELADYICDNGIANFTIFYRLVTENFIPIYEDILVQNHNFFVNLCKGNYQRIKDLAKGHTDVTSSITK